MLVHGLEPGQAEDDRERDRRSRRSRATRWSATSGPKHGTEALVADVRHTCRPRRHRGQQLRRRRGQRLGPRPTRRAGTAATTRTSSRAVRVTQAFLPDMRAAGWGRVVFVATVGATRPGDRIPEYYAAKGALPSMAVSLAKHLGGTGITVNCVSPASSPPPRSSRASPNGRAATASAPIGRASSASSSTPRWRTRRGGCRRPTTSAGSSPSW